jgi:hypothetical protein
MSRLVKIAQTLPAAAFIAALLLALGAHPAFAESDFERGYREGYGRGYQDGLGATQFSPIQSSPARRPSTGPAGIVVIRARYGDDHKSCDLTAWAAKHFNSRTSAEVDVSNQICGDPSPGNRKSLHVEYLCNGQTKMEEAYEHRRLSLSCF